MNKKQARAEGLNFTGHYERYWERDKIKNIAAVIRKLYKCRVVMVEEEGGISLYADAKYDAIRGIRDEQRIIDNAEVRIQRAKEEYLKKVEEITSRVECAKSYVAAQEEKFPEIKGKDFPDIYDYMRANNIAF